MSVGFLLNNRLQCRDDAVVWRGLKKNGIFFLYFLYLYFLTYLICSSLLIKARSECLVISETLLKSVKGATLFFFIYKNVVFPAQAEYSYFSADFRLKIFLYYS